MLTPNWGSALRASLEIVSLVFWVFILAGPVVFGAWLVIFNRRFSIDSLRHRKAMWKMGFTEFDVRVGRVSAVVIGSVFVVGGLVIAAQTLFP